MDASAPNLTASPLKVRSGRASSVIVQRVAPESADVFMEWQHGVTADSAKFPHYQATEIYPPQGTQEEWVVIIHFDDAQSLQNWLDSPQRAGWVAKLPCETRDFRMQMLPSGFGGWFAGLDQQAKRLPHWKMALTVLFGLYPTVMVLSMFMLPYTQRFGTAVAILLGNAASVSFLEWLGMPVISRFLNPWLHANDKDGKVLSLIGGILIVGALGLMTFLFYLITRAS